MLELVEKRQRIETKMMNVVSDMRLALEEVENMMLAGYEGRHEDVNDKLKQVANKAN